MCDSCSVLRSVAVIVGDGVSPFELGLLCEAWGIDRRDDGVPLLDFAVCAPVPGRIAGSVGFDLFVEHDLRRAADVDLVCVAPIKGGRPVAPEVLEVLRATVDRGARVLSVCSAAFILGEAGLLDGRSCTTHWMYADELGRRFPAARVVPEVLFVDEDPVITSAGTGAGIDAALHLWRKEFGASIASAVARRMVLPPIRDGGQAQYVRRPVPQVHAESLGPLLTWIRENLDEPLDVALLARQCAMSPRTFARRFRDETGTTPHAWVTTQRVAAAEELLESSDLPVERIATDVGFANAATLRQHFVRVRGVSPQRYRRTFAEERVS